MLSHLTDATRFHVPEPLIKTFHLSWATRLLLEEWHIVAWFGMFHKSCACSWSLKCPLCRLTNLHDHGCSTRESCLHLSLDQVLSSHLSYLSNDWAMVSNTCHHYTLLKHHLNDKALLEYYHSQKKHFTNNYEFK